MKILLWFIIFRSSIYWFLTDIFKTWDQSAICRLTDWDFRLEYYLQTDRLRLYTGVLFKDWQTEGESVNSISPPSCPRSLVQQFGFLNYCISNGGILCLPELVAVLTGVGGLMKKLCMLQSVALVHPSASCLQWVSCSALLSLSKAIPKTADRSTILPKKPCPALRFFEQLHLQCGCTVVPTEVVAVLTGVGGLMKKSRTLRSVALVRPSASVRFVHVPDSLSRLFLPSLLPSTDGALSLPRLGGRESS